MATASIKKKKSKVKIPDYLVYEILDDKKIYYKNYEKVLSGQLPKEAVMGSSDLQAWIVDLITKFLHLNLDYKKYKVFPNEVGYYYTKTRKGKWLNLDIAIVSREKLKKPQGTYLKVPPEVVIEVDTKADLSEIGDEYFFLKTKKLLESGVKKVIWIYTQAKKIMVAQEDKEWKIVDWNYDIEIIDGIIFNLEKKLEEDLKT